MKRAILAAFSVALIAASAGCASRQKPEVTRERVVAPDFAQLPAPPAPATPPTVIDVSSEVVAKQLTAIIGDLDSSSVPMDSSAFDVTSDLEILTYASNDRVGYFVDLFSGKWREQTLGWLSRGTRYEPMIRSRLKAAGLPEDLYFLAFVESGFSPDAYSSAAAVGMWQFMTATAKGEGLKVDWWVDERRDPALSTDAAVRHLSWLRGQFGSLFLAAAAYNGGSGLVSRGLTRHAAAVEQAEGEEMFFALAETDYLRQETRDYVPKIIAAALVAKSPRKFNLAFDSLAPLVYDSVRVGPAVPLAAVAAATRAPGGVAEIAELNGHVLRGVTHPRDSMWLRVPVGSAEEFRSAFRALPAASLVPFSKTTSRAGETFAAVAKRVGIRANQLAWYNPRDGVSKKALPTGTTILVPSAAVLSGAKSVPDPAIEIYGGSGSRYVVKRGDTLGGIALRFRTSVAALKRLNKLSGDAIRIGQAIRVR